MPTVRGRSTVDRFFAGLPLKIERNLLRGAGKAGARVVVDEIKARTPSEDVRDNIRTRAQFSDGEIRIRIDVKPGWARSVGIWLEYGTSPHFISVDDSQRMGMSVGRINEQTKAGSLVIGGKFVGSTIHHPGARPYPAFRPALDTKAGEAIAAAQDYINSRVGRSGIAGSAVSGGEDE